MVWILIEFCVIGKDLLVENYFINFKNIYIKLVGNLCVFFVIYIFIIMIIDELWYIKIKECFCDKKKKCKVFIRLEV